MIPRLQRLHNKTVNSTYASLRSKPILKVRLCVWSQLEILAYFLLWGQNFPKTWYTRLSPRRHQPRLLKAKKTNFPPPKAWRATSYQRVPKGDFMARDLHANNLDLATGSTTPKISQSLSKLEVSQCPSSMQKWIYTPRGHKNYLPNFSFLLPPPLASFHSQATSRTRIPQCALLLSSAICSQAISSVFPPPTWPLRAKQQGHYSQSALPPPRFSHLFILPKSRGSYFPTCSKPSDTL